MGQRFTVQIDLDAVKEYDNLDGSVISIVDKAIDELQVPLLLFVMQLFFSCKSLW